MQYERGIGSNLNIKELIQKVIGINKKSKHNSEEIQSVFSMSAFGDLFLYEKDEENKVQILKRYIGSEPELIIPDVIGKYRISICEDCFSGCSVLRTISFPSDIDFVITKNSFVGCSMLEEICVTAPGDDLYGSVAQNNDRERTIFDEKGILYVNNGNTIIIPENHGSEECCFPEGIEKIHTIVYGKKTKTLTFPQSLKSVSFDILSADVELFFKSSPKIVNSNKRYWDRAGNFERRSPVHVPASFEKMIQLAKERRWPIYIHYGKNLEFRADGRPEMKLKISLIAGTNEFAVTGATDVRGDVIIPQYRDNLPIVRIAQGAFRNAAMDSLVLPDTLREIEKSAFEGCRVREIIVPESVKYVDSLAFRNSDLEKIVFSGGQCQLKNALFSGCHRLKEVVINSDVAGISDSMFKDCSSLERIQLPGKIKQIENDAFRNCKNLRIINLPSDIEIIGSGAFMNSGIEELVLPDNITDIPQHMCHDCTNLNKVTFSPLTRKIGFFAFRDCHNLTIISDIDHLDFLGEGAFENCFLLNDVVINSVDIIGKNALAGTGWLQKANDEFVTIGNILIKYCGTSEEVIIPDNIRVIGDHAFSDYSGLYEINPWMTGSAYRGNEIIRKVTVGSQVEEICTEAFWGCKNLKTIELSNPEIKIGKAAFKGTGLIKQAGKHFAVINDMLADFTALADNVVIPSEIKRILPGAFSGEMAKHIDMLIIGNGIRRLDNQEFISCSLNTLVIPATVIEIFEAAFSINTIVFHDGRRTKKLSGIKKIICTKDSPVIPIAEECGVDVEIVDEKVLSGMIEATQREMDEGGVEQYLRCDSVIEGHKLLDQVKVDIPLGEALNKFEAFVEMDANEDMLNHLFDRLIPGMQKYGIASDNRNSNWSAVAVTAVFLSQYGYLTDNWYHLINKWYHNPYGEFMRGFIESAHPILECYNNMRTIYYDNPNIRKAINYACVHAVTVENKHIIKQAWQGPGNYCYCLYRECSKAQSDEERRIYNRLIGVLRLLAELDLMKAKDH